MILQNSSDSCFHADFVSENGSFFQTEIFVFSIIFAKYVLDSQVCYTVDPMYLHYLIYVDGCPFIFISHCFPGISSTITVLFLGIHLYSILLAGCIQFPNNRLKLLLSLCHCLIEIPDVC